MSKIETPTQTVLHLAEKVHRPLDVIQADIAKARAEWRRLEPICRDYYIAREQAKSIRADAQTMHKSHPTLKNTPFNELLFPIPPEGTPETKAFHEIHYTVAILEKEFKDAQAALTGG